MHKTDVRSAKMEEKLLNVVDHITVLTMMPPSLTNSDGMYVTVINPSYVFLIRKLL